MRFSAFGGCHGLKVYITDLESWCKISFYNESSNPLNASGQLFLNGEEVHDLVIPDGIQIVNYSTFYGCKSLTSLKLPKSVISIGEYAFCGAGDSPQYDGMRTLRIPLSVTKVGTGIFNFATFRDVCFYCEAPSKPSGWSIDWHLKDGVGHPYENKSSYYTNIYWGA
jgi:hypothetical protein